MTIVDKHQKNKMNDWFWLTFRAYGTNKIMGATIIQGANPDNAITKAKLFWLHPTALVDVKNVTDMIDHIPKYYRKKLLSPQTVHFLKKELLVINTNYF